MFFMVPLTLHILLFIFSDSDLIEFIKKMSPSAIDLELRSLEIVDSLEEVDEERIDDLICLVDFLLSESKSVTNFELTQAIMNRTLTVSGFFLPLFSFPSHVLHPFFFPYRSMER